MSKKWPGGIITPTPATPTGPLQNGSAPGIWTLSQQAYWQKQGLWPIAGNAPPTALFGGGQGLNTIDYITIATTGNATDFGDLTLVLSSTPAACASSTRGIWAGGYNSPTTSNTNVIQYVTIASAGNATDFGDLITATRRFAGGNNSTRGVFGGGYTTSATSVLSYVTITTTGNATSFGTLNNSFEGVYSCCSPTRCVWAGGNNNAGGPNSNVIEYVTTASTGNATDFGDLTVARSYGAGCSSNTRGLFGGGITGIFVNNIDYITIASTGNATDFGDLNVTGDTANLAAASSTTRGVWAGGTGPDNTIQYVTIATTGNTLDFGDLTSAREGLAGLSNANGGL